MWELILKHLPTFGWILGGAVVLAGVLNGTVKSAKKVLGKDIGFLDRFGYFLLGIALYSILGGIGWLALAHYTGKVSETYIFPGLLIGGLVGSVIVGKSFKLDVDEVSAIAGIAGGIMGGITGGIIGWMKGGIPCLIICLITGLISGLIFGLCANMIASVSAGAIADRNLGLIDDLIAEIYEDPYFSANYLFDELEDFGKIIGVIIGVIVSLIGSGIAGLIVGSVVASIGGKIDGMSAGIVIIFIIILGGPLAALYLGEISGIIGGVIGGIVGLIIAGIDYIIFIPFSKFLTPVLILIAFRKTVCVICFRYSMPLRSIYNYGTRHCEHCNAKIERIRNIKQVIGVIGGDVKNYKVDGDKLYVNLWFEKEEKARNADIDILEIRRSNKHISYDLAIHKVHLDLYNDASRDRNYVKTIPVIIEDNQLKNSLSPESMHTLEYYFGGVKGVIKDA